MKSRTRYSHAGGAPIRAGGVSSLRVATDRTRAWARKAVLSLTRPPEWTARCANRRSGKSRGNHGMTFANRV